MLTATINLNTLAAVSLAVSNEETRYYLCGVCLEVDADGVTYIATNGEILLSARETLPDDAERNTLSGSFILPTEICRAFKVRRNETGVMAQAQLTAETPDAARMTITWFKDARTFNLVGGTFPNWRNVIPDNGTAFVPLKSALAKDARAPQFQGSYLATMQTFALKIGCGKNAVHVHYGDDRTPAPVTFLGRENAFGVVMPIQGSKAVWKVPAWADKALPTAIAAE
jgi:DNA polymerase III sliding clamp (beta) subunit (PCNA family)